MAECGAHTVGPAPHVQVRARAEAQVDRSFRCPAPAAFSPLTPQMSAYHSTLGKLCSFLNVCKMWFFFSHVCVAHMCVCRVHAVPVEALWEPRYGTRSPRPGHAECWEPPHGCWKPTGPLKDAHVPSPGKLHFWLKWNQAVNFPPWLYQ